MLELTPAYFLDDNWENPRSIHEPLHFRGPSFKKRSVDIQQQELIEDIRKTRIEIAEKSETEKIRTIENNDYLKSELGMNIILPKGKIEELRFKIELHHPGGNEELTVIDGFPKDKIDQQHILDGKITLTINKLFKFIPVIGEIMNNAIDVELKPWTFKLGNLRKVNVDFSGGLTTAPEWYFKKNGLQNDLRVALTIKKSKKIAYLKADVNATWIYDPGFLKKVKVGTETKTITIL